MTSTVNRLAAWCDEQGIAHDVRNNLDGTIGNVPNDAVARLLDLAEATQLVGWIRPQDERREWHPVYVRRTDTEAPG